VNAESIVFARGSFWSSGMSTPMCRMRSPCCARAASGHAAAPSPAMNSRRRISALQRFSGKPTANRDALEPVLPSLGLGRLGGRAGCATMPFRERRIQEDLMHTQIIMDRSGDTRHQFDPDDASAVAEAERRFAELTKSGFIAAKRTGNGTSELIRKFDPSARETVFVPRLVGG
jgi:hypothetical protein